MNLYHKVWLSLGSNLGDRQDNLIQGIRFLISSGLEFLNCSGIYETEPVGVIDQPLFLNMVIKVKTKLKPTDILKATQAAEQELKRERILRWGPRTLDVDILLIDGLKINQPELTVPHPRMYERAFVLGPLAELDQSLVPNWQSDISSQIVLKKTALDVKMLMHQQGLLN